MVYSVYFHANLCGHCYPKYYVVPDWVFPRLWDVPGRGDWQPADVHCLYNVSSEGCFATAAIPAQTIPAFAFVVFQMMFATITPLLLTGAYAERFRFGPFVGSGTGKDGLIKWEY